MSRALWTVYTEADRKKVTAWIWNAPAGTRVELKATKRTTDQNARMWSMLTDIATQQLWHGLKLNTNDWKLIFLNGLKHETRIVPNFAGDGFMSLGTSSSDLSKGEMSDMMELMAAWGAEHGVIFHESETEAAA